MDWISPSIFDSTVLVMIEKVITNDGYMLYQRIGKELKPRPGFPLSFTDDQLPVIELILNAWPPAKFLIDKTGLGEGMAETLQKKYGETVEAVQFSSGVKDLLMQNLREMLRLDKLKLLNIPVQKEQILSMEREQTITGNVRYHPPTEGMHDDWVMALSLACWGAREEERGFTRLEDPENISGLF